MGVTISGPPETLGNLFESTSLKDSKPFDVGSHGTYNASHLYSEAAVCEVLSSCDEENAKALQNAKPRIPIFSPVTGSAYTEKSCDSLLKQVVADILIETANITRVIQGCAAVVKDTKCRVVPIGPFLDPDMVVSRLQHNDVANVSLFVTALGSVQRRGTGNHKASKIAIVGMSGRFPGGQDIHEFWEMLQKGLDMHKEVSSKLPPQIVQLLMLSRFLRTDLMRKRTMTQLAKTATKATPLSVTSLRTLVSLIRASSICLRARPPIRILCKDLPS